MSVSSDERGASSPHIWYADSADATYGFDAYLESVIRRFRVRRVLEIGGGANPKLSEDVIRSLGLEYTLLDLSSAELAKAPSSYLKVQGDVTDPSLSLPGEYDLVFSKWLAEHVRDGALLHRNVRRFLAREGVAFHFFPTLYAPPFVVNRMLPERLGHWLLRRIQPGRDIDGREAKFPAYYSWCRGPVRSQIAKFESLGYRVEEYVGFFGHSPYYRRVPPVRWAHEAFVRWLIRHPIPWITTFAYVLLSKAADGQRGAAASTSG